MRVNQTRLRLLLWLISLWMTSARVWAQAGLEANPSLNVLTQAVQVLTLTPEEAKHQYPIRLSGVVTCFDQRAELCFVQDQTAGIYVYNKNQALRYNVGDRVEVVGVSDPGSFSPFVHWATLKVIGTAPLPSPKIISIEQLASGKEDSQWVQVEGIVHRAVEDWGHLLLDVVAGTYRLKARILNYPQGVEALLTDAKVRVQGVAGTSYNKRGQLTGFHLLVPSYENVAVLSRTQGDPFVGPVRLSRSILAYSREGDTGHRVRVRGVVTLHWPGQALFIQDESGGLQIQTDDKIPLEVGDVIEVMGFPTLGGYTPSLKDAIVRKVDTGPQPKPALIKAVAAFSGDYDKVLVQVEAELLALDDGHPSQETFVLQQEKTIFQAHLPTPPGGRKGGPFLVGSRFIITGVCSVAMGGSGRPSSFALWMRSPQDVAVLQAPPWWKLNRLLPVVVGLGLIFLVGLLWVASLRKGVLRQTEVLRRREGALEERYRDLFENANDIIYTIDLGGRLTSLNKAGEQILGYSRQEALHLNLADIVVPERRERFAPLARTASAAQTATALEIEVTAKSGKRLFLEVISRPNYQDGQIVGTQGIARDITDRKEAEAALRQSDQELRASVEEREKLARDLHDGLIQSIYAVGLNLEDCRHLVRQNPSEVELRMSKAVKDLSVLIAEVRGFILGLKPPSRRSMEFKTALNSLIQTMDEAQSLQFGLQIDSSAAETLSSTQTAELLYIAREAVSNSLRHAKAKSTVVSLRFHQGSLLFQVRDDGCGFDPKERPEHGRGLRNMADRAEKLGARFAVVSEVGKGTRIELEIPEENPNL